MVSSKGTLFQDEAVTIDMELERKGDDQIHFVLKVINVSSQELDIELRPEERLRQEYTFHFEV